MGWWPGSGWKGTTTANRLTNFQKLWLCVSGIDGLRLEGGMKAKFFGSAGPTTVKILNSWGQSVQEGELPRLLVLTEPNYLSLWCLVHQYKDHKAIVHAMR